MAILSLAVKSLLNRRFTFLITLCSIAISVTLLLGVQTLKTETKTSFMKSIAGTDLIIGSRGSSAQLLLSSVFHIGDSTNTIQYERYQEIAALPAVKWAIPIALGDSHRGYTVVATNQQFFTHFSYAEQQHLKLQSGHLDDDMFSVVIGADVAKTLNYHIGDRIVMTHGGGEIKGHVHDNTPYQVSAILAPSFTAIDQSLLITLEAMHAMHADTHDHLGALPGETLLTDHDHDSHEHDETHQTHDHDSHEHDEAHQAHDHDSHEHDEAHQAHDHDHDSHEHDETHQAHDHDSHEHDEAHEESHHEYDASQEQRIARLFNLKPEKINAIFVGLTSPHAVLGMQNYINNMKAEPLTAIIPAVALQSLWALFSIAEVALNIVTIFVVLVGLLGMLSIILMSLNERRREMAILRSVGARPSHILALIVGEAGCVCFAGILLGVGLLYGLLWIVQAPLANNYGFYLEINPLTGYDLLILFIIQLSALMIALIPGALIYKYSLADGLNIKF